MRRLALATVALTLAALAGPASALAQAAEETSTSTSDWFLIAIEGLVVIGFIALGVRTGGIGLAEKWPFMIAVAIFGVAALTTSQSAATRTMVPLGLALGIGAGYMIAMWTAVVGVLFLPANGTQIAAAEADSTGTTTLGKRVIDHSFQLPLQVAWISTALVGIAIVAVFH